MLVFLGLWSSAFVFDGPCPSTCRESASERERTREINLTNAPKKINESYMNYKNKNLEFHLGRSEGHMLNCFFMSRIRWEGNSRTFSFPKFHQVRVDISFRREVT